MVGSSSRAVAEGFDLNGMRVTYVTAPIAQCPGSDVARNLASGHLVIVPR